MQEYTASLWARVREAGWKTFETPMRRSVQRDDPRP